MHTKISIVLLTGLLFSFDILPMQGKKKEIRSSGSTAKSRLLQKIKTRQKKPTKNFTAKTPDSSSTQPAPQPQSNPKGPRVGLVELLKQKDFENVRQESKKNNGKFTYEGRHFEYRESVYGTFDEHYCNQGYIFDEMKFDFEGELKEYGRFRTYRTKIKGTSTLNGASFEYRDSKDPKIGLQVKSVTIHGEPEASSLNTKTKVGIGAGVSLVGIGVAAYYFRDTLGSWISKIPSLPAKIAWGMFNK